MITDRMLTRPLVVSTPGDPTEDPDYGTPIPGEPTTVTVLGYLEETSSTEETVGQQTTPATWWAAVPTGTAVTAESKVTVPDSGQTFQVVATPAPRWHPWRRRIEFLHLDLAAET